MLLCGVLGLSLLFLIVAIVTFYVAKIKLNDLSGIQTIYLGKMVNSDSSIQDAMRFLKLTNSITSKIHGEK